MLKRLIDRVQHIDKLEEIGLPRDQYALTGGAWLAIMQIRENKDIDIVVTEELHKVYASYFINSEFRKTTDQFIDKSGKHGKKQ
ncbi:hypothetical protein LCGC14_1046250, partial [marine sediment metagenome]